MHMFLMHLCVSCLGKGPLKDMYVRTIKSMDFNCVKICTLWLSAEDYPVLLGMLYLLLLFCSRFPSDNTLCHTSL